MGLIRFAFSLAFLAFIAYALFLVPIGGEPLAGHIADVWRSDLVQKKVAEVRSDVAVKLEEQLAEAKVAKDKGPGHDAPSPNDRQELTKLIGKLSK
jgi:hypothetical protein